MRVTGALLVGGASRRFGAQKALAEVGGRTLAEIAWDALAWCDERLAFGKDADELRLPFAVRDDGIETRAPIAGVVAALRAAREDVCVVVPVDVPRITEAALRELAAACLDAAAPPTGPLPGAYRKSALPTLEARLAAGELGLRDALGELRVAEVPLEPQLLLNVNRREDLPLSG
jgi:molybdenum cofactor guanylyltransferase